MDDSNASGLCEEPDADFFDTFFDDGVLETLGEVFAEKPTNDSEDSSIVEETISFSSPNVASDQASLQNTSIEDGHQKKTEVITFKPAQIHDREKTSEHSTSNVEINLKPDSSCVNLTSHNIVQRNALKQLAEFQKKCSTEVKLTNSQILASETFSNPKKDAEKEGSVSLEELLAKVSKFVKETPVCNENPREKQLQSNKHDERQAKNVIEVCASVNTQFSAATIVSENVGEDVKKKNDNQSLLKEPLSCTSTLENSIEKNVGLSSEVDQTIIEEQEEEEEGELKEDSVASSSILSTSNGCVTTGKSTNVIVKTVKSKDEAEKENDLTLEKTFHKNENFRCSSEKKTKIPINLKSQLLASTTIINSGSASKSNGIFTNQNEKGESSLSSKDIYSSLSSLSDVPGPSHNSLRDKQKRRRKSFSTDLESSDDDKCELRSDRRRRKSKKRSKDDDSPKPRRRKESKKSKHKRSRSRSRSRSPYRSYRRRMSPKRSSYKRQRASSKSPESYRGRKSRSPHRRRSRSRSRTRSKSKSKSVTRAKSPFINHVDRLYKQWGIEWGTEDKARRSLSHHSHHPMPVAGPWSSETANATSTTIVSNTLSVSGESLHVHSTSFTSIGAFPHGYQGYMSGVPSGYGSNHYGGAEYSNFNGETYSGFLPNQPAAVQVPALDQTLCLPEIPGMDTSIPPPMIQAIPEDNSLIPSLDTTIAPPTASVLRKQLDILKSTVASLPDPCVSTNKTGNDSALPIPNIPEVDNNTININETTKNLVSTDDNSTSLTPADKISKKSTSSCESSKISKKKSPKKSTSIDKSSTNNPIIISRPNLTPVVLSPDTSSKTQSKSQTNDEICLQQSQDMTYLVENSDETKVSSSPNIIQGADSDSDIIIEEPPPKPPVELICLSPDEGDGGIENNSKLDDCGKGNNVELAANNNNGQNKDDEEVNNIYDLDKELDKIGKDNSKRLLVPPGYKKRKRRKGKKSSRKEIEDNSKNKEITRKEKPSSSETIPDETQNPVIKECLEMIDSLRIGRFVVVDKSNLEPITHKDFEISNSLLKTRPTTEFSFTKKTNLEVNSKTRNVSTNTSTQLCIDVCIGTDNTVMQKDANNQTNFECSGCSDKMDLLQQMKIKLLQLEKECSDLRAKLAIQSIPGLDASSGPTATGSKESHLSVTSRTTSRNSLPSDFSRGPPDNSHSKLTGNLCSISSDKGKEPINESQKRKKMGEPPVAFDYCHESPYLHSPF